MTVCSNDREGMHMLLDYYDEIDLRLYDDGGAIRKIRV